MNTLKIFSLFLISATAAFALSGCATSAKSTSAGAPPSPAEQSDNVVSRTITLSGANGSSLRVRLRGENQAELNSREACLREAVKLRDLRAGGSRATVFGATARHLERYGSSTRRASLEQVAVMHVDTGMAIEYGLPLHVEDNSHKLVARVGVLMHKGKLTPAYELGGTVHFVE